MRLFRQSAGVAEPLEAIARLRQMQGLRLEAHMDDEVFRLLTGAGPQPRSPRPLAHLAQREAEIRATAPPVPDVQPPPPLRIEVDNHPSR